MKFIKTGIHKIFLLSAAWNNSCPPSSDTSVHPVTTTSMGGIKSILTLSHIFDNRSSRTGFLSHFPQCGLFILFSLLYCSFWKHPSFIPILIFLYKRRIFPRKITTPPQLVASIMISSSYANNSGVYYTWYQYIKSLCPLQESILIFCKYNFKLYFPQGTSFSLPYVFIRNNNPSSHCYNRSQRPPLQSAPRIRCPLRCFPQ